MNSTIMNRKNYLISLSLTTLGILIAYILFWNPFSGSFLGGDTLFAIVTSFAAVSIILILIHMKNRITYLKIGKGLSFTVFFIYWFFASLVVLFTIAKSLQGFEIFLLFKLVPAILLFLYSSMCALPLAIFAFAWQLFFISSQDETVQGFWNK